MPQFPSPRDYTLTTCSNFIVTRDSLSGKEIVRKEESNMAIHHGGKVGKAGKTLASKSSNKTAKSKAGTTLANHKAKCHNK